MRSPPLCERKGGPCQHRQHRLRSYWAPAGVGASSSTALGTIKLRAAFEQIEH